MEMRAYLGIRQNDYNRQRCREPAAAEGQQLQATSVAWVASFIGMFGSKLGAISSNQVTTRFIIIMYIKHAMPSPTRAQEEDPVFKLLAWVASNLAKHM